MHAIDADVSPFYRAAHLGLRALDARGTRRRFGPEADARWRQFRGALTDADRFDLLLRDAAALAPLAFAPREVYALAGLSVEDPFGPEWRGARRGMSGEMLRSTDDAPADPLRAFDAALAAWERAPTALDPERAPKVTPSTRLLVGGTAALRHVVAVFAAQRHALDLAEQVILVADAPHDRQLFGLAAVFLGTTDAPRTMAAHAKPERLRALGFTQVDATLVSDDASAAVRDTVAGLADALRR